MIKAPVKDLKPGQILARDVVRPDGVILIPAGKKLSAEEIPLLERLDIVFVFIEGEAFKSAGEKEKFLTRENKALDRRFSRVEHDPILMAIREMFRENLNQRILSQKAHIQSTAKGRGRPGHDR
jgi:hypothetical protein